MSSIDFKLFWLQYFHWYQHQDKKKDDFWLSNNSHTDLGLKVARKLGGLWFMWGVIALPPSYIYHIHQLSVCLSDLMDIFTFFCLFCHERLLYRYNYRTLLISQVESLDGFIKPVELSQLAVLCLNLSKPQTLIILNLLNISWIC